MFTYSIAAYLIGFASILYWIASVSHLFPDILDGTFNKYRMGFSFWPSA